MTENRPPFEPLAAQVRGHGELVVCLHSSSGSSAQWRGLAETLAERWQVLCPDLHGHGRSPAWPATAGDTLHTDAAAVTALAGPGRFHLVGHSYGAAVALQIALRHPERVRSLTLYEPVVFGLLRGAPDCADELGEIEDIAASVAALVGAGCDEDAARVFTGYWGGAAAWTALSQAQRRTLASRVAVVPRHFRALFAARWQEPLLHRLQMPVLLLRGSATRAPAARVAERLAAALPQAQCRTLAGAGHLGPLTHAATVAHWMAAHIDPRLAHRMAAGALAA